MRTTKKLFLSLTLILAAGFLKTNAQILVGAGLDLNMPMGKFADDKTGYKMGMGGGIDGRYMLTEQISGGLTIDFAGHKGKAEEPKTAGFTYSKYKIKQNVMTVLLRGDYYFSEDGNGLYGGLGLGFGRVRAKQDIAYTYKIGPFSGSGTSKTDKKSSGFAWALRGGYLIPAGESLKIDVNVSYNSVSAKGGSIGWLGIHAGILYKLGI